MPLQVMAVEVVVETLTLLRELLQQAQKQVEQAQQAL
jgi:urease accessory protein UreE